MLFQKKAEVSKWQYSSKANSSNVRDFAATKNTVDLQLMSYVRLVVRGGAGGAGLPVGWRLQQLGDLVVPVVLERVERHCKRRRLARTSLLRCLSKRV